MRAFPTRSLAGLLFDFRIAGTQLEGGQIQRVLGIGRIYLQRRFKMGFRHDWLVQAECQIPSDCVKNRIVSDILRQFTQDPGRYREGLCLTTQARLRQA